MKRNDCWVTVLGTVLLGLANLLHAQNARLWSTYYGGTATEDGAGASTATDASGNVYLFGNTASTSSIATAGAHQTTYGGGTYDCYLVKFDANGNRLWATYVGGNSFEYGYHVLTDATGNVYICGETGSTSAIATGGTHDASYNGGGDAFIIKFNSSGVRLWGTYFGGSSSEHFLQMALDASGNVYAIGFTFSTSGVATAGAHQTTYGGVCDGTLAKFNSSGVLQWSTYMGGANDDNFSGLAIDASGNIYTSGYASSPTAIASGGFQNTLQGTYDMTLSKWSSSGLRLWSTYFGGPGVDYPNNFNVTTDPSGNAIMTGRTTSTTGVATPGAHQTTNAGGTNDGFVAKVSPTCSLTWATYYGGTGDDICNGLCSDAQGNLYITGRTSSNSGIASGGFQNTYSAGNDGFLLRMDANGARALSTYYGGAGNESLTMAALDINGKVYCCGVTTSNSGIASGGFQNTFGGVDDGFLVKFDSQCPTTAQPGTISGNTSPCVGAANTYSIAPVAGASYYTWTLPGGWSGTSTTTSINATVGTSGTISVVANNGCGASTPQTLTINSLSIPSQPGMISGSDTLCQGTSGIYSVPNDPNATSYTWTLPGGWSGSSTSSSITATAGANGGTITVIASNACGPSSAQTLTVTTNTAPVQPASITGSTSVCQGSTYTYSVPNDPNAASYTWTLPGGWSGSSTTNSITVTATSNSGTVSVVANNVCGFSSAQSLSVTANSAPAQPVAITGSTSVCQGSTYTYSVPNDPNAASYTWTLPGGWSGSSTTNSITVTANGNGGNITVIVNNGCGASAPQVLTVTASTTPTAPGAITGSDTVCAGGTVTLSVPNDPNATSYTWSLPGGWSGSSTNNTIIATAGNSGGSITVAASNSCGNSAPSTPFIIAILPAPLANFSTITNTNPVVFNDLSQNQPQSWAWDFGDGGNSTSQNPTHNFATPGQYTVCLIVSNPCGTDTFCNAVDVLVGLDADAQENAFIVTPNPNEGIFYIHTDEGGPCLLVNALGQRLLALELEPGMPLKVEANLPAGLYYLQGPGRRPLRLIVR